ncbi:hypothetical protein ACWDV4_30605 [Micromonospora sp. NPDC003197]
MTEDEVRLVEGQLRELFVELNLGWALAQVDSSVAEGRVEAVHRYGEPQADYAWALWESNNSSSRGRPAVTNRPLSVRDRAEYLVDALSRVLVDLPVVNKHTWEYLNRGLEGRLPMIQGLAFVPDEESFGDAANVAAGTEGPPTPELNGLRDLLIELRGAIRE